MQSYFDRQDGHGNERPFPLIPEPSLRDQLRMSVVHETTERARLQYQADFILDREAEVGSDRAKILDQALEELRKLLEDGEQGFRPGKVVAVAEFCKRFR